MAKVKSPQAWKPQEGDTLEGYYGGTRTLEGRFDKYEVIIVYAENQAYTVSGCKALSLIRNAGMLNREDLIRFVYLGKVDTGKENKMNDYELYVQR